MTALATATYQADDMRVTLTVHHTDQMVLVRVVENDSLGATHHIRPFRWPTPYHTLENAVTEAAEWAKICCLEFNVEAWEHIP